MSDAVTPLTPGVTESTRCGPHTRATDARLNGVLQAMTTLRAEIVAALAALLPNASNGR
jgi:hypothetical protein